MFCTERFKQECLQKRKVRYDATGKYRDRNFFSKTEKKETTPTGLRNMHKQESGKFDEKKKHKMEANV